MVITAYRVCDDSIGRADPRSSYAQQWALLRQQGHSNPNPRQQFFSDLGILLTQFQQQGHECILMLDANKNFTGRNSALAIFAQAYHLTDLHLQQHCDFKHPAPATHIRGRLNKRIDYIFGTTQVAANSKRAGILAFNEILTSDHRSLFVDLDLTTLLKGEAPPLDTPSSRLLHSTNVKHVAKYQETLYKYCHDHHLYARAKELESLMEGKSFPLPPAEERHLSRRLNGLQNDITCSMLAAENLCGATARHPWSPALVKHWLYWGLWCSQLRLKRDFSRQRSAIQAKINWTAIPTMGEPTMTKVKKLQKEAAAAVCQCKHKAKKLRKEYLSDRANHWAQANNVQATGILRALQAAEASRTMFAKLRHLCGNHHSMGGLSAIKIPDENSPDKWKLIVNQDEITSRLIQWNQLHFSQATGTPFTTGPLLNVVGRNAEHGIACLP